jgi:hypothetical protein
MKGATSIQERLWELRKDKGLNLEELSKLTGISKSALGNYEKDSSFYVDAGGGAASSGSGTDISSGCGSFRQD